MGQAGLYYIGLLALTVAALNSPVRAQQLKPPSFSEQALRKAAFDGQNEKVRLILDKGVKTDAPDPDGRTALMMAAFNGHTETIRLLRDRGAIIDTRDAMGRTALMYAASGPYLETVRLLLEKSADVNRRDTEEDFTALMFATAEGQSGVIQVLLAHGADTKVTDKDGDTALDFAEKNGHQEAAKILKTDFSPLRDSK